MKRFYTGPKKKKRLAYTAVVLVILLAAVALILSQLKLISLKEALSDLVYTETQGTYRLEIGHSAINVLEKSFELDALVLHKVDSSDKKGILKVRIPYFHAKFGSLVDLVRVFRLDIMRLDIYEPIIETGSKDPGKESPEIRPGFAGQIIKLYVPVKKILERFNIESLVVNRAALNIEKTSGAPIGLSLINLFVHDWDMSNLSEESQIKINIDRQVIDIPNVRLSFEGIEFNARENSIKIHDYRLQTKDTTAVQADVAGKTISLNGFDYEKFIRDSISEFQSIHLLDPTIRLTVKIKPGVKDRPPAEHPNPLAGVGRSLENFLVDTLELRNAELMFRSESAEQSIESTVERLDLALYRISTLDRGDTLSVSDYRLDASNIGVNGGNLVQVRLEELTLSDRILSIGGLRASSVRHRLDVQLKKALMRDVSVESALDPDLFYLASVELHDGSVTLHGLPGKTRHRKSRPGKTFAVDRIQSRNIALHYRNGSEEARVKKANARYVNFRSDRPFDIGLLAFNFAEARYSNPDKSIDARISDFELRHNRLQSEAISLSSGGIAIRGDKVEIAGIAGLLTDPADRKLELVRLGSVQVSGELSAASTRKNAPDESAPDAADIIRIDRFSLGSGAVDLKKNEDQYALKYNGLEAANLAFSKAGITRLSTLECSLSQLRLQSRRQSIRLDQLDIDYPQQIVAQRLSLAGDRIEASVPRASIENLALGSSAYSAGIALLESPVLKVKNGPQVHIDSVLVYKLLLSEGAMQPIDEIRVYAPEIHLSKSETGNEGKEKPGLQVELPTQLNLLKVYDGRIVLPGTNAVEIGEIMARMKDPYELSVADVSMNSGDDSYRLNQLNWRKSALHIDSIFIEKKPEKIDDVQYEGDEISLILAGFTMAGIELKDTITLRDKKIDLSLGYLNAGILRNKQLPDPPEKRKPGTLYEAVGIPLDLGVQSFTLSDGVIRYSEISETTGLQGSVELSGLAARVGFGAERDSRRIQKVEGAFQLQGQPPASFIYRTIDSATFSLDVDLNDFDLKTLNTLVLPIQSVEVKSGKIGEFVVNLQGDDERAHGHSAISYSNLHIRFHKHSDPMKMNLGSQLLTLIADGIVLKHNKNTTEANFVQERLQHKSPINYWIKSVLHGGMATVRKEHHKKSKEK